MRTFLMRDAFGGRSAHSPVRPYRAAPRFVSLNLMQTLWPPIRLGRRMAVQCHRRRLERLWDLPRRFLRWNSWDVVVHPFGLFHDLGSRMPFHRPSKRAAVSALFGTFLFLAHLMLQALTI